MGRDAFAAAIGEIGRLRLLARSHDRLHYLQCSTLALDCERSRTWSPAAAGSCCPRHCAVRSDCRIVQSNVCHDGEWLQASPHSMDNLGVLLHESASHSQGDRRHRHDMGRCLVVAKCANALAFVRGRPADHVNLAAAPGVGYEQLAVRVHAGCRDRSGLRQFIVSRVTVAPCPSTAQLLAPWLARCRRCGGRGFRGPGVVDGGCKRFGTRGLGSLNRRRFFAFGSAGPRASARSAIVCARHHEQPGRLVTLRTGDMGNTW